MPENEQPGQRSTFSSTMLRIVTALAVTAIIGGVYTWSDGRVTAADLANHKESSNQKIQELSMNLTRGQDQLRSEIVEMRKEIKDQLKELSQTIDRANRRQRPE